MYGFATRDETLPCNYLLKDYGTAIFLSIIFGGLGADWLYLADGDLTYILVGLGKLILTAVSVTVILLKHRYSKASRRTEILTSLGILSLTIIWWAADWIRIIANAFPDGNGFPLRHEARRIYGVY